MNLNTFMRKFHNNFMPSRMYGCKNLIRRLLLFFTFWGLFASSAWAGSSDVAVIIGNQNYASPVPSVQFARRDAQAMKRFVIDILGIKESNVIELLDATQSEMLNVFGSVDNPKGRLFQYVRKNKSNVFVFYSGHGVPGPESGRSFLLPVDAAPDFAEINGYPIKQLYRNLSLLGAKTVQVVIDACFSGQSVAGPLIKTASAVFLRKKEPVIPKGITVITAAEGNQLANWDLDARYGLFTNYFLEGAYGAADRGDYGNGDSKVTLKELKLWLDGEMSYVAKRKFKRNQTSFVYGDDATIVSALPHGKKQSRPKFSNSISQPLITTPSSGEDFRIYSPNIVLSMSRGEGYGGTSYINIAAKYLENIGIVDLEGVGLNGLETIVNIGVSDVVFEEGTDNSTQASQVMRKMFSSEGGAVLISQSSSSIAHAVVRLTARSQVNGAMISVVGNGTGRAAGGSRRLAKRKAVKQAINDGAEKLSQLLKPHFLAYAALGR